jgi:ABC-type transport system substrate-binding protein
VATVYARVRAKAPRRAAPAIIGLAALIAVPAVVLLMSASGRDADDPDPDAVLQIAYRLDDPWTLSMVTACGDHCVVMDLLFRRLYRYDHGRDDVRPVPDLAAAMPSVSDDGRVWTVPLRNDVSFHDGSAFAADDVVHTVELAMSHWCGYGDYSCDVATVISDVRAIDASTVQFTLTEAMGSFLDVLQHYQPTDRGSVEASYGRFAESAAALDAGLLDRLLGMIPPTRGVDERDPTEEEREAERQAWTDFVAATDAGLDSTALTLPDRRDYLGGDGLDAAGYGEVLAALLKAVELAQGPMVIDAVSAAYPFLDLQVQPNGTGPYMLANVLERKGDVELVRFDEYFDGRPPLAGVSFRFHDEAAAAAAIAAGDIDILWQTGAGVARELDAVDGLRVVEYPNLGWLGLQFNLREGRLFADRDMRHALAMCLDRDETVRAATDGEGVPVDGPIHPTSWAFPEDAVRPFPHDPDRARALIEGLGWKMGDDGIYARDGRRLATAVPLRSGRPDRMRFMVLLAQQVRECGIDITLKELPFLDLLPMLTEYPHINAADPEAGEPFDLYFGGFSTSWEPDPYMLFHSSLCTSEELPESFNYACYAEPEIDRLLEAGRRESDLERRKDIYRQFFIRQASDLPVLYAYTETDRDVVRDTVRSLDGFVEGSGLWLGDTARVYKTGP